MKQREYLKKQWLESPKVNERHESINPRNSTNSKNKKHENYTKAYRNQNI